VNLEEAGIAAAEAAMECIRRKIWKLVDRRAVIGIAVGDRPLAAASVAAEDDTYGVMLLVGEHAIDDMRLAVTQGVRVEKFRSELLMIHAAPAAEVPQEFRAPADGAGIKGLTVPMIVRHVPHKGFSRPRKLDYEFVARALNAMLLAEASGRLENLGGAEHPRVTVLEVSGRIQRPKVTVSIRVVPIEPQPEVPALATHKPPPELEGLPRSQRRYAVDVHEGDLPFALGIVVDLAADRLLGLRPIEAERVWNCRDLLHFVLCGGGPVGARGLPAELAIGSRDLFAAIAPELTALGVACRYQPRIPEIEIVAEQLEAALASEDPESALVAIASGSKGQSVARDSRDPRWWKEVDRAVTVELIELGWDAGLTNAKAWRRYLGLDFAERDAIEAEFGGGLGMAFHDWYCHVHRGGKRSRTLSERLIESEGLDEDLRAAARARAEARAGIYRVDRVEAGEGCELEEVRTGERLWVDDRAMSLSAEPGIIVPLRAYRIGPITASVAMGPTFGFAEVEIIVDSLEKLGMPREGLIGPEHWHLFGKLWAPLAERRATAPTLQNTAGEPLRMQRGRYRVGDPLALADVLAARPGVEETEPGERWHWALDDTVQAHLCLIAGHELEVEVNSDGRLERVRAWLDAVPGLEWQGVEMLPAPWEKTGEPADDSLPRTGPIDPREAQPSIPVAEIQAALDEKYFGWLDEPIPALGGASPREFAGRSAEGRRKVARMIRTYPDPGGIRGLRVPREAMLRELGLGDAEASS